ncbi:MAG TPA: hypothetical protein VF841_15665 [Anaeromyxobacter sp.]
MLRSRAAPPGARVPLLVLAVALAAGAVMFLRVHRGIHGASHGPRSFVAAPVHGEDDAHRTATP